jgi:hypothetical protein
MAYNKIKDLQNYPILLAFLGVQIILYKGKKNSLTNGKEQSITGLK